MSGRHAEVVDIATPNQLIFHDRVSASRYALVQMDAFLERARWYIRSFAAKVDVA